MGENRGENLQPIDKNGVISIQDTIFQTFHNIKSQLGGCIYIHKDVDVKFDTLGFVDCTTTKEGGALNIKSHSIQIQSTCAYLCVAYSTKYQFAKLECNVVHNNNQLSFLTITSCGPNNAGHTSLGLCGACFFNTNNLNSSHNMNNLDKNSFGTCFRTHNVLSSKTICANFINSKGYDVFSVHFDSTLNGNGTFESGNVYNCSTKCIFKFWGRNIINKFKFGKLEYTEGAFLCGSGTKNQHSLTFTNSKSDHIPWGIDSNVKISGGCNLEFPFSLHYFRHIDLQNCPVPTKPFTESSEFTMTQNFSPSSQFTESETFSSSSKFTLSRTFSPSSKFTSSLTFSPSSKFTSSLTFSPSSKFTSSSTFSPSSKFASSSTFSPSSKFASSSTFSPSCFVLPPSQPTSHFSPSSPFTPSFTFSPNATKYPDGLMYNKADIRGRNREKEATAAQIGATSGISLTVIIVSVVFMLIYLRSRRRQLRQRDADLSDSFLNEEQSSSSYSYSYYTYEYYYTYSDDGSYSYSYSYSSSDSGSLASYSDFDPTYFSLDEQA